MLRIGGASAVAAEQDLPPFFVRPDDRIERVPDIGRTGVEHLLFCLGALRELPPDVTIPSFGGGGIFGHSSGHSQV